MSNQVDLTLRIGSDTTGIAKAKSELDKFFAQFKAGFNLNLGAKLADFVTAVPRTALNSLREYSQLTEEIVHQTERARGALGLSATAYQVFANTLAEADQDASALNPSLAILARTIGEAGTGSATAAAKLGAIGVTFQQLKSLAPERQLELVARRLTAIADSNVRDAATNDLLGRSYANLKPLLEALARDGFDGLARKVEATTGLIKDEHVKAIDDAGDRSENAGKRIAAGLAPALSQWKKMVASAKEYAASLVAGAVEPQKDASGAVLSARAEVVGKSVSQIEALISKEFAAYEFVKASITDTEIREFTDRLKVFEDALAQANANLTAEYTRNNPLGEQAYEIAARDSRAKLKQNELEFQAELRRRNQAAQAADERRDQQQKQLKYQEQEAEYAREISNREIKIAEIQGNRLLTAEQKSIAIQPLLREENALIAERIKHLQEEKLLNAELTPAERQQIQNRIDALGKDRAVNQGQQTSGSTLGFGDQLRADLVKLRDQFGTTAQQISGFITNSIGTAIDGISDGIYGLITRTKTWGQVGLQVGASLLQSLIKTGVQITANSILGVAAQKTQQTVAATTGPAIAVSYAPAVAATNTASWGSSAIAGAAAAAIAIGAIISMFARHADGGEIGGVGSGTSDSNLIWASKGEYMMREAAVRSLGVDRMAYINRTGRLPGFADGGPIFPSSSLSSASSGPAASSSLPPMYFHADAATAQRQAWANGHYDAVFVDVFRRVQHRL